jgi:hypothetical protein
MSPAAGLGAQADPVAHFIEVRHVFLLLPFGQ